MIGRTGRTGHLGRGARSGAALVLLIAAWVQAPAARGAAPEWNVGRVNGPVAGAGVIVAVVDTGVDASHPTFGGRVLPTIDLVGGRDGDPNGHGTHVAGTAGGGAGGPAIGVAPGIRILPVRVLDADGSGSLSTVEEGIRRATDAGASVINLSLGDDVVIRSISGSGLTDAIRYAWDRGAIPVLAAGNDGLVGGVLGSGYGDLPAVVVTATGPDDRLAGYATTVGSAQWGMAAPGGDGSRQPGRDVLSARPGGGHRLLAGTSMAAPHVAGALAALRASGLGPQQAVDRLLATARDIGPRSTYGAGLLDVAAALRVQTSKPAEGPAMASPAAPLASAPAPSAGAGSRVPAEAASGSSGRTAAPGPADQASPGAEGVADPAGSVPGADAGGFAPVGAALADPGGGIAPPRLDVRSPPGIPTLVGVAAFAACASAWALLGAAARRRRAHPSR